MPGSIPLKFPKQTNTYKNRQPLSTYKTIDVKPEANTAANRSTAEYVRYPSAIIASRIMAVVNVVLSNDIGEDSSFR
jgi:hypothetical protein